MTIAAQLEKVRDTLATWARDHGGTVQIAADPLHAFGLLANKPGAPRVVVMFQGEVKETSSEELGLVTRTFSVTVSKGRGFTLNVEDALIAGAGGGAAMFTLVEECREMIRQQLRFDADTTHILPDLQEVQMYDVADLLVDAYQITFAILTQLPDMDQS